MNTDTSLDLVAKLLANENLHVIRAAVDTASFNIKTRTLTLPQWKNITPVIDQMLVCHEVSHALFTTDDYTKALETKLKFPHAHVFLNILEDARIERLMKKRYPGVRKTFNNGYRELQDLDFFDVKNRDLTSAHLMDRINLHFKVGFQSGVTFSKEERRFVDRAESIETINETVQLAEDIYKFLQEQAEQHKLLAMGDVDSSDDGEEYDDYEYDDDADAEGEDGEELDEEGNRKSKKSTNSTEYDLNAPPLTASSLNSRIKELADTSVEYRYWELQDIGYDPIVPYSEIFKILGAKYDCDISSSQKEIIKEFKTATQNNIDYLVKEFEMRKSASLYKRMQTSKVGIIDTRKLWSYKIKDDIFKTITTVKQGKNHGIVFLLDWSGSMCPTLSDTIEQVINLVSFCRKSNIAFQVFAFTNNFTTKDYLMKRSTIPTRCEGGKLYGHSSLALLELFSNKMTTVEFNNMINMLQSSRIYYTFEPSGTPLQEALTFCYSYVEKFQAQNNVEKISFITLTDGEGASWVGIYDRKYDPALSKTVHIHNYIKDPVSKANIQIKQNPSTQTRSLLQMIKSKYNCTVIGFYILSSRSACIADALKNHYDSKPSPVAIDRIRGDFRMKGYSSLMNTGRDELFLVPFSSTKISYNELQVTSTDSAKTISSRLTKHLKANKTSRILLDKFIQHVA